MASEQNTAFTVAGPQSLAYINMTPASEGDVNTNEDYHMVLLVMYSVIFLCGTISLSLMVHFMKSSSSSPTSIVILNLIFAHFLFLLTVPFRIHYYASNVWCLGAGWCKIVSSMVHFHMYISFILYAIILITRLLMFYNKTAYLASVQRVHALIISAVVWTLLLIASICTVLHHYGKDIKHTNNTICFKFGENIRSKEGLNYTISIFIIVVTLAFTALQANVLKCLYRKHQQGWTAQQEFRTQLKSFIFVLIMVVSLIPYHSFRLHYLTHIELENINEVFLCLTTVTCLDMLTFLGRRTCDACLRGRT